MKLLLYCTKGKPYLLQGFARPMHTKDTTNPFNYKWCLIEKQTSNTLNGKIIGECDFEVSEIKRKNTIGDWYCYENQEDIWEQAKLGVNDFFKYLEGKNGYAIHIKNLHIFDEPRPTKWYGYTDKKGYLCMVEKAPQNMMYCYDEFGNDYVLISIHPEWLCKILNGEKTIEVRKKVLRGML